MSNLVNHAEKELRIAGLFDSNNEYGGMLGPAILNMVKAFSDEGHSGHSASLVLSIFEKVASFEPLMPLTGQDDEWMEISDGTFQNVRCSHVFKENGQAYDLDGKIFREPNGTCYTNSKSRVPVTFPYVPKREYVDIGAS